MSKKITGATTFEELKQINKSNQTNRSRQNAQLSKSSNKFRPEPPPAATGLTFRHQKRPQPSLGINGASNTRNGKSLSKMSDYPDANSSNQQHGKAKGLRYTATDLINFRCTRPSGAFLEPYHEADWSPYSSRYQLHRYHHNYRGNNAKKEILQTKSQMILRSGNDFSLHLADSDSLFDWSDVEKLNVWSEEIPRCPICLEDVMAAPRITKCGHVYCWPCILRFDMYQDGDNKKCPVCNCVMELTDLRSVTVLKDNLHRVNSKIEMQLMRRSRGSAVALPVKYNEEGFIISEDVSTDPRYAVNKTIRHYHYLVATPEEILEDVIEKDMSQLEYQLGIVENDEVVRSSIQLAILQCSQRKQSMVDEINKRKKRAEKKKRKTSSCTEECDVAITSPADDIAIDNLKIQDDENGNNNNSNTKTNKPDYFYFYQVSNGQHIYLDQLNMKSLMMEYDNDFEKFPPTLTAKIVEINHYTMDEAKRRQHKFMAHLPLSLDYLVVELDLRSMLSESTLTHFKKSLNKRRDERRRRAHQEKMITRRAEIEALKRQGKYPQPTFQMNDQQFPGISDSIASGSRNSGGASGSHSVLLKNPSSSSSPPPPASDEIASAIDVPATATATGSAAALYDQNWPEAMQPCSSGSSVFSTHSSQYSDTNTKSFAQMLGSRQGGQSQNSWSSSSTRYIRSASSAAESYPALGATSTTNRDDEEDEDPDYVPPPSYQASFFVQTVRADAPNTADVADTTNHSATPNTRNKKKKKGSKKKVLFSTNSRPF